MNHRALAKSLGMLQIVFGASMAPALAWSLYDADAARLPIAGAMSATMALGAGLFVWGRRRPQEIFRREATAVVGLGWILSAIAGALPFYFARIEEMPTFIDCFFESMSGLTTTGSSVLSDIESLPRGILFWRSWMHWIGGLGIIMLVIAILPFLGAGGRTLARSEITGPVKEGLTPRIKDTARLLYGVYIGLTIAQTVALVTVGMGFFDALCHTFGTLATGGFSTRNASIASFDSIGVETVIIVFMILGGTNFALLHVALRGKPSALLKDSEWRCYMAALIVVIAAVATILVRSGFEPDAGGALRAAAFSVTSILTTTGFGTVDFDAWPESARWIMLCAIFVGACAGSTSGGVKMIRWMILFKLLRAAVSRAHQPNRVIHVKIGGRPIPPEIQRDTFVLFVLWVATVVLAAGALMALEGDKIDMISALSAVGATLDGVGPGLGLVGPAQNFGFLGGASKLLLSFVMLLGRLEMFAVIVLFIPRFWRVE